METENDSGFARADHPVPEAIRRLSGDEPVAAVWVNGDGGVACRIGAGPDRFAKWAPAGSGLDLAAEAERLRWAHRYARVPEVLDFGEDATGAWLVTAALPGESAITDRWKADPATAVRVGGAALRQLHEALPVEECPFDWSVQARLARAGRTDAAAEQALATAPPIDRLVVCHGDACSPNTLINEHGEYVGHVDLGSLGVADRWADLAIGTWASVWNYGPGWEETYLEAYGVEVDHERIRYYRELWDLT